MMSRILKGDYASAEDVVQEAFCRAWKFRGLYDPDKGKFSSWFNAILFNALRDVQQEARAGPARYTPEISPDNILADVDLLDKKDKKKFLKKKISKVKKEKHRQVLELFFVLGYTSKEISQVVDKMTQTNVTTIIMRFKGGLK
jgi:RNA polymerase sigma factor (sigma-70 family)